MISRCEDFWDTSGNIKHISEVFPVKDGIALQHAFDEVYLLAAGLNVAWQTSEGAWSFIRHRLNDRGDESTILSRVRSIKKFGVIQDIRSGAWLIPLKITRTISPDLVFHVVHAASLCEGMQRCVGNLIPTLTIT